MKRKGILITYLEDTVEGKRRGEGETMTTDDVKGVEHTRTGLRH